MSKKLFKNADPAFFEAGKADIKTDANFASRLFCEYVCTRPARKKVCAGYQCFDKDCPLSICKENRRQARWEKERLERLNVQ